MIKIKIKVKWDFSDTELEDLQYLEAMQISGLKSNYIVKVDDIEDFDVEDYLVETGSGILPLKWETIES
jgi:hypothetical protein